MTRTLPARATAQVAALAEAAWLPVLVAGEHADAVQERGEALSARLLSVPGVQKVFGLRGPERLFFALRWPLYLQEQELRHLFEAMRALSGEPSSHFAFDLLGPILARHRERANALYAASLAAPTTPDRRALGLLVYVKGSALARARAVLEAEAQAAAGPVRTEVEAEPASALVFGSAFPVVVKGESAALARGLIARVQAARARDPRFAFREARSIETYLPGEAQAQLALLQEIRSFLTSSAVARFSQAQRDALRPLIPAPLRGLPLAQELPLSLQALFRDRDGHLDRLVHLLPRPGLSPDLPAHVQEVERALAALGVLSQARGRFVLAAQVAHQARILRWLALLWVGALLVLLRAPLGAWLVERRTRRALRWLLASAALWLVACWGASRWLQASLAERVPWLQSAGVWVALPFGVLAEHPRIAHAQGRLEAEWALLHVSLPWQLSLDCAAVVAHLSELKGEPLDLDLDLGQASLSSSLSNPLGLERVLLEGGELALSLAGEPPKPGQVALSGTITLSPALFGRLPLLAEASEYLGDWVRSSAPRAVQVSGSVSAPKLTGLQD